SRGCRLRGDGFEAGLRQKRRFFLSLSVHTWASCPKHHPWGPPRADLGLGLRKINFSIAERADVRLVPETHAEREDYGEGQGRTGWPVGAALPRAGSRVISTASGTVARAVSSAIRRPLPSAWGTSVPSAVQASPCRAHAWYAEPAGAGGSSSTVSTARG